MQHVLDARHGLRAGARIGDIALDEFHAFDVIEIVALAGDQAIEDAHLMAATREFFREMRADEAGTAGHKV